MRIDHVTQSSGNSPPHGHRPSGAGFARGIVVTLVLLSGAAPAPRAAGGNITYLLKNYPGDQNGNTISGSITTDGVIGTLTASDIKSWSIKIDSTTFSSSDPDAHTTVALLEATPTTLTLPQQTPTSCIPEVILLIAKPHSQPPQMAEWNQVTNTPLYSGVSAGALDWNTFQPSIGGTGPWLIASVPEPTAAVLMGIGLGSVIACVLVRKRRAQRRQGAA